MPSTWFQYPLVSPGNIIKLQDMQWKILRQYPEQDLQATSTPDGFPSYASIKLECQLESQDTLAYMRIYMQVPFRGTEYTSPDERAKQAIIMNPRELEALSHLTKSHSSFTPRLLDSSIQKQDTNGPVPGGALVFLVWEIVPGVRLGNTLGSDVFFALKEEERNRIREALILGYEELTAYGYVPFPGTTRNLVWDSENNRLYFIGFRTCMCFSKPEKWRPGLYATWGVAKAPRDCSYSSPKWDGDTSDWVW